MSYILLTSQSCESDIPVLDLYLVCMFSYWFLIKPVSWYPRKIHKQVGKQTKIGWNINNNWNLSDLTFNISQFLYKYDFKFFHKMKQSKQIFCNQSSPSHAVFDVWSGSALKVGSVGNTNVWSSYSSLSTKVICIFQDI